MSHFPIITLKKKIPLQNSTHTHFLPVLFVKDGEHNIQYVIIGT